MTPNSKIKIRLALLLFCVLFATVFFAIKRDLVPNAPSKQPNEIDVVAKLAFHHQVEVRGASTIERAGFEKQSFNEQTFYLDIEPLITPEDFVTIKFDSSQPAQVIVKVELSSIGQKIFQNYASQYPDKQLVLLANNQILASFVINTIALSTSEFTFNVPAPVSSHTFTQDLIKRIDQNL